MRRIFLASVLLLSACATTPKAPVAETVPTAATPRETGSLIGLAAAQLVSRLGNPTLQVREGSSLKLQFRTARCVLDAYLYPHSDRQLRVTHVDTRAPSGVDTNQAVCIATFERAS